MHAVKTPSVVKFIGNELAGLAIPVANFGWVLLFGWTLFNIFLCVTLCIKW